MKDPIFQLCDQVREAAFDLHKYLKHGHLEKVYENGLANRLRKIGLKVQQQQHLVVHDEDRTVLGEYCADLFVEELLLVELKACKALANEHEAQLLGYLRGCQIEHELLVNFSAHKLEVRKFILS